MKITVDFDDLFKDYENDENTIKIIKKEVMQKAVEYLATRIGYELAHTIDKSFKEFENTSAGFDDFRDIAKIIIKQYMPKIKDDINQFYKCV